ncbi:ATP-binding protein [Streptomyces sp. I05A-00742]|uniref:ATP-binding protein n=1 Tax=Streptomyces sp. I05A-00742 TaxID=2732853 RepID=UPI0014890512|nr:ATP-binding protein [Streptomyces sp. I05A-00742]
MSTATLDHPRATGPYRIVAPADFTTVHLAREFTASVLVAMGRAALVDDACLCAAELVTNAVRHARTFRVTVDVAFRPGRVVVAVGDEDPFRRAQEGGSRLELVRSVCVAHGVNRTWNRPPGSRALIVTGKRVWCELDDGGEADAERHPFAMERSIEPGVE